MTQRQIDNKHLIFQEGGFLGVAKRLNDGTLQPIPDTEPVILFRGRDKLAFKMLHSYRYMTRLGLELQAYRRTGNTEHLYNIANYAHLEAYAPENGKFHYDDKAESVTREKGLE